MIKGSLRELLLIALVLLITGGCAGGFDSTKSTTVPIDSNEEKYQVDLKDTTTHKGDTKLMTAAKLGQFAIVQDLIAKGFDVNRQNSLGETALMFATEKTGPESISITNALIAKGANVNQNSSTKSSPLGYAVTFKNSEVIKILLDAGANPFSLDRMYEVTIVETAVIDAIEENDAHSKVVQVFYDWLRQYPDRYKKAEYERVMATLKKYSDPEIFTKWYRVYEAKKNETLPKVCTVNVDCPDNTWWWAKAGVAPDPEK